VAVGERGAVYASRSAPAPILHVIPAEHEMMLRWTIPSADLALQTRPSLGAGSWVDAGVASTVTNLDQQVILPVTNSMGFYRLYPR